MLCCAVLCCAVLCCADTHVLCQQCARMASSQLMAQTTEAPSARPGQAPHVRSGPQTHLMPSPSISIASTERYACLRWESACACLFFWGGGKECLKRKASTNQNSQNTESEKDMHRQTGRQTVRHKDRQTNIPSLFAMICRLLGLGTTITAETQMAQSTSTTSTQRSCGVSPQTPTHPGTFAILVSFGH